MFGRFFTSNKKQEPQLLSKDLNSFKEKEKELFQKLSDLYEHEQSEAQKIFDKFDKLTLQDVVKNHKKLLIVRERIIEVFEKLKQNQVDMLESEVYHRNKMEEIYKERPQLMKKTIKEIEEFIGKGFSKD